MGVYINMEMPKEGFVEILIRDEGTVQQTGQSYRIDGTDYYTPYVGEMPVMYKAIEVTEPHGRLGDLDELYNHLNEWYLTHEHGFLRNEKIYIRAMLSGVKDAPTVVPASAEVSA